MGQQFAELTESIQDFIRAQKMFFVATAGNEGRINISPKGLDTLRIVDKNHVMWLNLTGSGNETAAHVMENGRMTLMFCAFEGKPLILRVYGTAKVHHPRDAVWADCLAKFPPIPGARQIFDVAVTGAATSCGWAVPEYAFQNERDALPNWSEKKGPEGIHDYWKQKNVRSIDGKPTGIFE